MPGLAEKARPPGEEPEKDHREQRRDRAEDRAHTAARRLRPDPTAAARRLLAKQTTPMTGREVSLASLLASGCPSRSVSSWRNAWIAHRGSLRTRSLRSPPERCSRQRWTVVGLVVAPVIQRAPALPCGLGICCPEKPPGPLLDQHGWTYGRSWLGRAAAMGLPGVLVWQSRQAKPQPAASDNPPAPPAGDRVGPSDVPAAAQAGAAVRRSRKPTSRRCSSSQSARRKHRKLSRSVSRLTSRSFGWSRRTSPRR